ncbi:UNVERIFIED_ORG: type I restriction enzyme S subunit [Rhizobium esperanzae]
MFVDGPFGSNLKASEYVDDGVPLARIQNVRPNEFRLGQQRFIPKYKAEELSRHDYRPGDLVIAKMGDPPGDACVVPELAGEGIIVADVVRFRSDESTVDHQYLAHFLNSPPGRVEFAKHTRGSTRQRVNLSSMKEIRVPLPELNEQRRIAAILDKADAIRRKREQALILADDFLRSVFLELFGDPGDNPMNHPVETFDSLLSIPLRNGISPASRGNVIARVLTLTAITGDRFDSSYAKEGKFLEPISAKDTVNASDFYICRGNGSTDLIGKGFYADQDIPGTAFPDTMIAAKPNPKKVTPAFLESIWNGPFVRSQIREAARTTNGTFKINQIAAGAIKIPVPPMHAQLRFQAIVDRLARSKEKLAYGADLYPALSQRAFGGDL